MGASLRLHGAFSRRRDHALAAALFTWRALAHLTGPAASAAAGGGDPAGVTRAEAARERAEWKLALARSTLRDSQSELADAHRRAAARQLDAVLGAQWPLALAGALRTWAAAAAAPAAPPPAAPARDAAAQEAATQATAAAQAAAAQVAASAAAAHEATARAAALERSLEAAEDKCERAAEAAAGYAQAVTAQQRELRELSFVAGALRLDTRLQRVAAGSAAHAIRLWALAAAHLAADARARGEADTAAAALEHAHAHDSQRMRAAEIARTDEVAALRAELTAAAPPPSDELGAGAQDGALLAKQAIRLRKALRDSQSELDDAHRLVAVVKLENALSRRRAHALLTALVGWRAFPATAESGGHGGLNGDGVASKKLAVARRLLSEQQAEIQEAVGMAFCSRVQALVQARSHLSEALALSRWSRAAVKLGGVR
ncbi:hypothetical protein T492DRAFT_906322 [Pavlovales sp. CCMP2436]|nr:hypothetical protein T492DRAFT_906322 [Pavlovales sp. CCMP2436]